MYEFEGMEPGYAAFYAECEHGNTAGLCVECSGEAEVCRLMSSAMIITVAVLVVFYGIKKLVKKMRG